VGFRQWVASLARSKGLVGFAQNLDDGAVLISLTGPALYLQFAVLRTFEGPPKASVSIVNILSFDYISSRFEIL
jgi:acylphosphatase